MTAPMDAKLCLITYRYRVKDKHAARLDRMAQSVNTVWNYCNNVQKHAIKWNQKWPTSYDLMALTSFCTKELGLHSATINAVCAKYAASRKRLPWLRYRGQRSLGWVPFKGREARAIIRPYSVWESRPIPENAKIKDGCSFSQDASGHWYMNLVLEVPCEVAATDKAIGIDLGLKALASLSNGESIAIPQPYRKNEARLAVAQRAKKKKQVTNIHAKIANQRHDYLHKESTKLANSYGHIVVGNVNAAKLAKTKMAKSVLDAGWSDFRSMLNYKAIARCGKYEEVKEAYTTQTCSVCGSISGPKGIAGLGIREWDCLDCGAAHNRDHNAAKNILRLGNQTLEAGAALMAEISKGAVRSEISIKQQNPEVMFYED